MSKANSNDKVRHLIVWETPATGSNAYVEMYVNPTSLKFSSQKQINKQRTKGGFIIQYWGEEFDILSINGETGSGGIEALNVIDDIYRSEQIALQRIITSKGQSSKRRQSLAQLSSSVIMWYMGAGYRGYFSSFGYSEDAKNLGIFTYDLQFTIVEKLGDPRKNYLPWHRKPWSTIDSPVTDTGRGMTSGGAYGTTFKMGELNAPPISDTTGIITDPQFTSTTGITPSTQDLVENLQDNNPALTPSSLFANR
jgi:hypothetical protein